MDKDKSLRVSVGCWERVKEMAVVERAVFAYAHIDVVPVPVPLRVKPEALNQLRQTVRALERSGTGPVRELTVEPEEGL